MITRRTFLTASAAATGLVLSPFPSRLRSPAHAAAARQLTVGTRSLDVNGKAAKVYSLTNETGQPGLVLDPGAAFKVRLANGLDEETIVHWHGLTPPFEQDGVAGSPLPMLEPGESRAYDFAVAKPGTFWMHAHTLQEQNLLAAPLIVHSAEDRAADRQEVVVLLHDFSFTPAEELLARLGPAPAGTDSGGMDHGMMNHGMMDQGMMDHGAMMEGGHGGHMMGGMDLNDIQYDAYLANDRTLDDPEVVSVDKGGKVLLRIINGASSTAFTIETGALKASLVAVDGRPVQPVEGTTFPLVMAQRADLLVDIPADGGAFPILALREGAPERTGIVLATAGATVNRIAPVADAAGPVIDLSLETMLRSLEPLPEKPADREFVVQLAGTMQPYQWSMAGAETISGSLGERIEISMTNMSMMSHPMHLHGHDFQVVAINGRRFSGAVRDTVQVPPMATVTIAVDLRNPGDWAFHCHHLYHMVTGMMTHISVA